MLTKEAVLQLWSSEEYKKLSRKLIEKSSGDPLEYIHIRSNITNPDKVTINKTEYLVEDIIKFLDTLMVPFKNVTDSEKKYFRGDTKLLPDKSCLKENYISVSKNIEDAIAFIDDPKFGYLSEIKIDPNVKCVLVGVEGELLLQHGCLWEVTSSSTKTYDGTKYKKLLVKIHPPSKKSQSGSHSEYLACSLLKKQYYKSSGNQTTKKSSKKPRSQKQIEQQRERLSEFYNSYIKEAELLSESLSETRFLNTITEVNNISNRVKRNFFSKKKKGAINTSTSTNTKSLTNSNRVKGIDKMTKRKRRPRRKRKLSSKTLSL
jgi:hypothetical protein